MALRVFDVGLRYPITTSGIAKLLNRFALAVLVVEIGCASAVPNGPSSRVDEFATPVTARPASPDVPMSPAPSLDPTTSGVKLSRSDVEVVQECINDDTEGAAALRVEDNVRQKLCVALVEAGDMPIYRLKSFRYTGDPPVRTGDDASVMATLENAVDPRSGEIVHLEKQGSIWHVAWRRTSVQGAVLIDVPPDTFFELADVIRRDGRFAVGDDETSCRAKSPQLLKLDTLFFSKRWRANGHDAPTEAEYVMVTYRLCDPSLSGATFLYLTRDRIVGVGEQERKR